MIAVVTGKPLASSKSPRKNTTLKCILSIRFQAFIPTVPTLTAYAPSACQACCPFLVLFVDGSTCGRGFSPRLPLGQTLPSLHPPHRDRYSDIRFSFQGKGLYHPNPRRVPARRTPATCACPRHRPPLLQSGHCQRSPSLSPHRWYRADHRQLGRSHPRLVPETSAHRL